MPCARRSRAKASCVHAPPALNTQYRKTGSQACVGSTLYSASSSLAVCAACKRVRRRHALLCRTREAARLVGRRGHAEQRAAPPALSGAGAKLRLAAASWRPDKTQEEPKLTAGSRWELLGKHTCSSLEGAAAEVRWGRQPATHARPPKKHV